MASLDHYPDEVHSLSSARARQGEATNLCRFVVPPILPACGVFPPLQEGLNLHRKESCSTMQREQRLRSSV